MKKIYYEPGPPELKAGIAGRFVAGKYKPVSDKIAALLLQKEDFREADANTPADDSVDIALLEAEALAEDESDKKPSDQSDKSDRSEGLKKKGGNL